MLRQSTVLPVIKPKVLQWLVLFLATISVIFIGGKRRAFGSFIAELRVDFPNVTLTELNWMSDSYASLGYMLSGPFIMLIIYFDRRYRLFQFIGSLFVLFSSLTSSFVPNPHWLFLTHSLFNGVGSSLIISTAGLVVNEHFDFKHPYHLLATTLVSGGSVASIFFVALFAYLIQQYNWRMAFIILGGIYFFINGSGAIFFQKNDKFTEIKDTYTMNFKCYDVHKKQVPLLVLWFIDRILTSVVTYGLLLNLTDYVHRKQPNLVRSTILTTLFAAGEALTYIIAALITAATRGFFKEKLRYILLGSSILLSLSLVVLEFTIHVKSVRRLLIFTSGLTLSPSITFLFPGGEELTRLPGHVAYPFSLAGMGVGMLLSPLLTAIIADTFSYKWFFLVQGGLIFIKVMCLLVITILLFYYKRVLHEEDYFDQLMSKGQNEIVEENPNEKTELITDDSRKKM